MHIVDIVIVSSSSHWDSDDGELRAGRGLCQSWPGSHTANSRHYAVSFYCAHFCSGENITHFIVMIRLCLDHQVSAECRGLGRSPACPQLQRRGPSASALPGLNTDPAASKQVTAHELFIVFLKFCSGWGSVLTSPCQEWATSSSFLPAMWSLALGRDSNGMWELPLIQLIL